MPLKIFKVGLTKREKNDRIGVMEKLSLEECRKIAADCKAEVAKRIVGCEEAIDGILTGLIADGHVLLEGVPGLAKTLAVRTFADISGLSFKRIQFTPDLLPADLLGTQIYSQNTGDFSTKKGPVFANMILADEINRAGAKVQSALLEAMAERQVTIGDETFALPKPFFVLATQNPIDQDGTYALPEAEIDRFLLKITMDYPEKDDEISIVKKNLCGEISEIPVEKKISAENLLQMRICLQDIKCDDRLLDYIVTICDATRRMREKNPHAKNDFLNMISFGASPRASLALAKCAKINALFEGREFVLPEDIQKAAPSVLRHRLILSYEAAAEKVTSDMIIHKILKTLPLP